MRTVIVCRSGPDSRERARDRILSRPSVGGSTHFISKRGGRNSSRNSAGYQPLRRRAGGIDDRFIHGRAGRDSATQFLPALNSFPNFRGVGSLIPGLARVHLRQKSPRCISQGFQLSILSAGSAGLVTASDRHRSSERKSACRAEKFSLRSMN